MATMAWTDGTARGTIVMEVRDGTPTGAITTERGGTHRFSGWIDLSAALEAWHTEELSRGPAAPPQSAASVERPAGETDG